MTWINTIPSMPICSPSYPRGPFRFVNREFLTITYRSSVKAIQALIPEPLQPDGSGLVLFHFMKMPNATGLGPFQESGITIPCLYKGESVNFTSQMYIDSLAPIVAGREIWGFPHQLGTPNLEIQSDTLVGTLKYGDEPIATASMQYKHRKSAASPEALIANMKKTQVNLKLIPSATGELAIAQLIGVNLVDISIREAWEGEARLSLTPHVSAPCADLPVLEVLGGTHLIADITLPYGRILHNYLNKKDSP